MPGVRDLQRRTPMVLGPCDLGCWWWWRCKHQQLACLEFEEFVEREGITVTPPVKFSASHEIYERVFINDRQVGRPKSCS